LRVPVIRLFTGGHVQDLGGNFPQVGARVTNVTHPNPIGYTGDRSTDGVGWMQGRFAQTLDESAELRHDIGQPLSHGGGSVPGREPGRV